MENQDFESQEELEQAMNEDTPKYVPRPAWQIWAARVALVLFIALIVLYMIHIARGGL